MTEDELLSLPKVRPDEASAFLGGDPTAQYIRLWCQDGDCRSVRPNSKAKTDGHIQSTGGCLLNTGAEKYR